MFTWADILLIALKIINAIMSAVSQDKWMQAGRDAEIAEVSKAIMAKTQAGKGILEKGNALSDSDVDAQLRGLEPK